MTHIIRENWYIIQVTAGKNTYYKIGETTTEARVNNLCKKYTKYSACTATLKAFNPLPHTAKKRLNDKTIHSNIDVNIMKRADPIYIEHYIGETDCKNEVDILDKNEYEIVLNRKLANDTKIDFLLCAIYHELCHIIQFNEAFDNDIIDFNKKAQSILNISINETLLKNTIFDFAFHSQLWEDIAKEINSKIKLTVPVKAFLSSVELNSFLEDFYMKNKPIFTAPATIIDYTISGLTINDIENFTGKSKNSNINEQLVTDVVLKHEYKKWLKEETYDK